MSEFDELVAADGVLMAGRFGPDGAQSVQELNKRHRRQGWKLARGGQEGR